MSLHSYSRVWLHLVWATLERRPLLSKPAAAKLSEYLIKYSAEKGFYMKCNHVNSDHVHALVDLPTGMSIEDMIQLFKGSSSHWINRGNLIQGKFAWGRGYGVFSVSHSGVPAVTNYISGQEAHHHKRSFADELKLLVERHKLVWRIEPVETGSPLGGSDSPR